MLRLYNTLTRKIEDFTPINPPEVKYYSCGPTVYDFAHIGHARTYVFADILERVLIYNGYKVKRVMNITDVGHLTSDADSGEDKMEKGAAREKMSVWDLAKFYTIDFFEMLHDLNIIKPQIICAATDYVVEMIKLIKKLEEKGFTYKTDDGIYFDTTKLSDYGKLTGRSFDELQKELKAGARIEMVKGKKNPTDFALWKFTPKGVVRQMEWDSPWGKGFPGWHIECSAMSMEKLGNTIDIHTGGVDHIPIHHTNEIAQSEAATGKLFVKYWLHADHLLVEDEKMSKSLKNFFRLDDLRKKGIKSMSLRYLFLTAHYRKQLNFTWKGIDGAQRAYDNLINQISSIKAEMKKGKRLVLSTEKLDKINKFRNQFLEAVNNDLNTPQSLAVLWDLIRSNVPPSDKYDLVMLFDEVLGLKLSDVEIQSEMVKDVPENIQKLVQRREGYRREKKFIEADRVRMEVEKEGYIITDTSNGSEIRKI